MELAYEELGIFQRRFQQLQTTDEVGVAHGIEPTLAICFERTRAAGEASREILCKPMGHEEQQQHCRLPHRCRADFRRVTAEQAPIPMPMQYRLTLSPPGWRVEAWSAEPAL